MIIAYIRLIIIKLKSRNGPKQTFETQTAKNTSDGKFIKEKGLVEEIKMPESMLKNPLENFEKAKFATKSHGLITSYSANTH